MKRASIATKRCDQLKSNDTYFAYIWLSYLKTANEVMATGVNYCVTVKTIHKDFCPYTLENVMKYSPGGSYLTMKSTPIVPGGRTLIAIA